MDAFYCSVEELDAPSLKGRPVVVGGTPEGRGVVATANYAARKFGVHSAMPAAQAVRLCPKAVFLRPRPKRYAEASRQVFSIFEKYTPLVEPLSIDEAFLDVTASRLSGSPGSYDAEGYGAGEAIARELHRRIEEETGGLTCSIGIASNKYLAKIASDLRKPRAIVVVPLGAEEEFLAPLPIKRIWGVGPKTLEKLQRLGVRTVADIEALLDAAKGLDAASWTAPRFAGNQLLSWSGPEESLAEVISHLVGDKLPWLSTIEGAVAALQEGRFSPDMAPPPDSFDGLRAALDEAKAALEGTDESALEDVIGKEVRFEFGKLSLPFDAEEFLLSFSQPNYSFHAATAYDILRMLGIKIGKTDFLGRLRMRR